MHLTRDAAADHRRAHVIASLARHGVHTEVQAVRGAVERDEADAGTPGDLGGRHVVRLVAEDTRQGLVFGAYGRHSHEHVAVTGCLALTPVLRRYTRLDPIKAPHGLIRHLIVRASSLTRRTLATIVVRRDSPGDERALREFILALRVDGAAIHVNARPGDGILDPAGVTRPVFGTPTLEESTGTARLHVGPTDFFQTNPAVARRMWADLAPVEGPLVDLYAGIGAVAMALAVRDRPSAVFGVEVSAAAVARARENAELNGIEATFLAGKVGEVTLPDVSGGTVVLDPPRRGLEKGALQRALELQPKRIVYVACEPEALGRDLAALLAEGWRCKSVIPYDMFPQTPHVEVVAELERGD